MVAGWIYFVQVILVLVAEEIVQIMAINRVCYLRPDPTFPIDHVIQQGLCTHIIIAFCIIDSNGELSPNDSLKEMCIKCRQAIEKNGSFGTKLMISIGGGGAGGFELATSTAENRSRFVLSILNFIRQYSLDGIDIDWEFPSWNKNLSRRVERVNFVYLLKDIREQFNQIEVMLGKSLVLSTAVAAQLTIIRMCYQPKEIGKYVTFINLMSYDFYIHKWYWPFVGHNSALHSTSSNLSLASTFTTKWAAEYWHSQGVPKSKIMVGIPTYGKRFTLISKDRNHPGAIATGSNGDCTYTDVCIFLRKPETIQKFDDKAMVPYAFNGNEWISYENEFSARNKAQWIVNNGFGGVMLFSLNADDYKLRCKDEIFPIHSAVRDELIAHETTFNV
ncbi:hypothetical protein RDWZM_008987 [Blomia tropicalis]|uniref:GH18 domain-containing protein n=1 Tax=Blomia tropicalis TaxID=40697 RepID=A0A9Q0M289_BLOTA|nr:hypothetical protein RDWZM_008987 [Blomia tropicalis]